MMILFVLLLLIILPRLTNSSTEQLAVIIICLLVISSIFLRSVRKRPLTAMLAAGLLMILLVTEARAKSAGGIPTSGFASGRAPLPRKDRVPRGYSLLNDTDPDTDSDSDSDIDGPW